MREKVKGSLTAEQQRKIVVDKINEVATEHKYLPRNIRTELSSEQKAEQLWGIFLDYSKVRNLLYRRLLYQHKKDRKVSDIPQDEKDQVLTLVETNPQLSRLRREVSWRWHEPGVKANLLSGLENALRDFVNNAVVLREYRRLSGKSSTLQNEYFQLLRNQYDNSILSPTLHAIDIAQNQIERDETGNKLKALQMAGGFSSQEFQTRGGLDLEHANITALLAYERLFTYHQQFRREGVIHTPSRVPLMEEVVTQTARGNWVLLSGETGSGKTTFVKFASRVLNGEDPKYASGHKYADVKSILGTKSIDANQQVYHEFGPLTASLTGFSNSLEMAQHLSPTVKIDCNQIAQNSDGKGKVLLLDEINKFDPDTLMGALKVVATLKPGERFNFQELHGVDLKKAKSGFGLMATMNPANVRYERKNLDITVEKLFIKKDVVYLPMTAENPELYEAFLAILMDDHGRIRIAKEELAPSFVEVLNPATNIRREELNPDVKSHGVLYRFALAAAEIHKSFRGLDNAAKTASDPGYLEKTVLDMGILTQWISEYSHHIEYGDSLTTFLEKKIAEFCSYIDNASDKAIFERIFKHLGFGVEIPKQVAKPPYSMLTPREIGYLTPRTPRWTKKEGEEAMPNISICINKKSGAEVRFIPKPYSNWKVGEKVNLPVGPRIYLGVDPDDNSIIAVPENEYEFTI